MAFVNSAVYANAVTLSEETVPTETQVHNVVFEGEEFVIEERITNGARTYILLNHVDPSKVYLAELAIRTIANPDFNPYEIEPYAHGVVLVNEYGTEYYKRVIGETGPNNNAHATTQAYYTCNNASYQGTGYDQTSAEVSAAWYGSGAPTRLYVNYEVSYEITNASTDIEISVSADPSIKLTIKTSRTSAGYTATSPVSYTQVVNFYPPELTLTHQQLQGGYITECNHTSTGYIQVNNTVCNPVASVQFVVAQ